MAGKKSRKKAIKSESPKIVSEKLDKGFWLNSKWHLIIIAIVGFCLYANTLSHEFTQDDAIVIYDNMHTQKGVSGIPGLLSKDTFHGFFKEDGKAKLVSGGRYRPFTPILFAIGYELYGKSPFVGHLMNILWYIILSIVLYSFLKVLLANGKPNETNMKLVLLASLIFVCHPIHTEVVANIKGRDEIFALLGALVASYLFFKPLASKWLNGLLMGLSFFIGLMSKENAITFLAVVPLAAFLFRSYDFGKIFLRLAPMLVATIVFLVIRTSVIGLDFGGAPMELMNNPYLKIENGSYVPFSFAEKSATITYTLGKYVQLLVFPITLTHDYYPYHIPIMQWSDWTVWLSVILYLALGFFIIYRWGKNSIPSFSILYFLITLSIVSNVVFPIGTNMSERFLFMPSVGFSLLLAIMLVKYVYKNFDSKVFIPLSMLILVLFSLKTITRNQAWKNDFTLFQTDVKTSSNSAKVLNAAGGSLLHECESIKDENQRIKMADEALDYLDRAIKIHPNYRNAYLLAGNAHYFKKEYPSAIKMYEKVLAFSPNNRDGVNNLAVAYRDQGRFYGEVKNDLNSSINYLQKSYQLNPTDLETLRLLGISYGLSSNPNEAVKYFKKSTELNPNNAGIWINLSLAYQQLGQAQMAEEARKKALAIDPNVYNK